MSEIEKKDWKMFINNEWVDAQSGETLDAINPCNNEAIGTFPAGDKADVERAVQAAVKAFREGPWRRMNFAERMKIFLAIANGIEKRIREIAVYESAEAGKPIADSEPGDIPFGADCYRYYAGAMTHLTGETIPVGGGEFLDFTVREPLGVIGAIIPWNFPFAFACDRTAAAIASGNSVVLKPSSESSITALMFGEILAEAGLPEGVVNIVTGSGSTAGAAIGGHPQVAKITLTGSVETGISLLSQVARDVRGACMELGGKSPNIIFEDADLDQAARTGTFAAFFGAGQVCSAGTRFLVQDSIYDDFLEKFVAATKRIKVGDCLDPATHMGPIISSSQLKKIEGYFQSGLDEGAKILFGGDRPSDPVLSKGNFLNPTIFVEANNQMRIAREEIFGPVVTVLRFSTEEEAIEIANDTEYGLAAGIWTKDIKRAHQVARQVDAGNVWINTYNLSFLDAPWGGFKKTGGGKAYSPLSVKEFTRIKNVCVDLNPKSIEWPAGG